MAILLGLGNLILLDFMLVMDRGSKQKIVIKGIKLEFVDLLTKQHF